MARDALKAVVQEILIEKRERINVLVIGLGGGSDAQHAFVVGQHVMSEVVPESQRGELVYGTNKWADSSGRLRGSIWKKPMGRGRASVKDDRMESSSASSSPSSPQAKLPAKELPAKLVLNVKSPLTDGDNRMGYSSASSPSDGVTQVPDGDNRTGTYSSPAVSDGVTQVPGSVCGLFSVEHRDWSAEELNKDVNGRPRWVGTTMFEATIPSTTHNYDEKQFTSPIVVPLMKDRSTASLIAKDLAMLAPGAAAGKKKDSKKVGNDIVAGSIRSDIWDLIIGVDSGGDVLGGMEDSRDTDMLHILQGIIDEQDGQGRLLVAINGLCVDGETFFKPMNQKLKALAQAGALLGRFNLADVRGKMDMVTRAMAPNKTPRIILDGILGQLESRDQVNDIVFTSQEDENEFGRDVGTGVSARRRRGSSSATTTNGMGAKIVHELLEDNSKLIGSLDGAGVRINEFIQIPARHHKDSTGQPIPSPIVPLHWITHSYIFDGSVLLSNMRIDEEVV